MRIHNPTKTGLGALGRIGTFIGKMRPGNVPPLSDPNNPTLDVAPADLAQPLTREQQAENVRLSMYIREQFGKAARARQPLERDWVLAIAMREGRQWLGWDDATNRCISLIDNEEQDRYITDPLIEPLILKWAAIVTMTKPDASCVPYSESDADRMAANEGRVILGHCDRRNNLQAQNIESALWMATTGAGWKKLRWNPDAYADIPIYGPDGMVVSKVSAPVGDVEEEVLDPFQIYLDPSARRFEHVRWMIHATLRPLSWFQETYGEAGYRVQPNKTGAFMTSGNGVGSPESGGYVDPYSAGFGAASAGRGGSLSSPSGIDAKEALCLEYWEIPSPRFPKGRYAVLGGEEVMHSGDWPYERGKLSSAGPSSRFPFLRAVYQEGFGHPYGRGMVPLVAPLQVAYNRLLSRMVERFEQDKLTVAIEQGSGLEPDAFSGDDGAGIEEGRNVREIRYRRGSREPSWMMPPPLSEIGWRLRDTFWTDMQHIIGIHDVDMGSPPPGVTAGIAMELLQQADRTQMALPLGQLEAMAQGRGEWLLSLYSQFASANLPRMMGLDDSGNPNKAKMQAQTFKALTGQGSCTVYVAPGSATPKTPGAETQQILDFLDRGLFGVPGSPEAAEMAVRLLSFARSDEVLEHLRDLKDKMAANQPDPAQVEAIRQQGQKEQQQNALNAAAQMEALKQQGAAQAQETMLAAEAAKAQIDGSRDLAKEQAQAAIESQRHGQQMQVDALRHEQEIEKILLSHHLNPPQTDVGKPAKPAFKPKPKG